MNPLINTFVTAGVLAIIALFIIALTVNKSSKHYGNKRAFSGMPKQKK